MNILISLDGVSHEIFARYSQDFINNGFSYCKKLITTFPSVTFNAHATAITGNHHPKHFVVDNIVTHSKTMERIELYGDHDIICNETLHKQTLFYSLAKNALKSCCIHWYANNRKSLYSRFSYRIQQQKKVARKRFSGKHR